MTSMSVLIAGPAIEAGGHKVRRIEEKATGTLLPILSPRVVKLRVAVSPAVS